MPGEELKAFLDTLDYHVAIVNYNGDILHVNSAWESFARENGTDPKSVGVGVNYLQACRTDYPEAGEYAEKFLFHFNQLKLGRSERFTMEYPCHCPDRNRWFVVRAYQYSLDGKDVIAIGHLDITARKGYQLELQRSRETLRKLNQRLHLFQEEENRRISREIHDIVGSHLAGLKMDIVLIREYCQRGMYDKAIDLLDSADNELLESMKANRAFVEELRLTILEDQGLVAALERLIQKSFETKRVAIETDMPTSLSQPPENIVAKTVYRCAQEAITNCIRHARCSQVKIMLREKSGELRLSVSDNGQGFEPEKEKDSGYGLLSMQERVRALRGQFAVNSAPGVGTTVEVRVPAGGTSV